MVPRFGVLVTDRGHKSYVLVTHTLEARTRLRASSPTSAPSSWRSLATRRVNGWRYSNGA